MELIVIHKRTRKILFQGDLIIIPGIGTKIHIDKKPFLDEIQAIVDKQIASGGLKINGYDDHGRLPANHRMETNPEQLRGYAAERLGLNPHDFTTVLDLEHCPITGDTKAFVGSVNELKKVGRTDSKVANRNNKSSSNSRREDDNDFLDGFLLTGALIASLD